jgi:hypothetical protein
VLGEIKSFWIRAGWNKTVVCHEQSCLPLRAAHEAMTFNKTVVCLCRRRRGGHDQLTKTVVRSGLYSEHADAGIWLSSGESAKNIVVLEQNYIRAIRVPDKRACWHLVARRVISWGVSKICRFCMFSFIEQSKFWFFINSLPSPWLNPRTHVAGVVVENCPPQHEPLLL